MASIPFDLKVSDPEPYVVPAEVYSGSSHHDSSIAPPIKLRIATGGAGQSGILRALCNAFIDYSLSKQEKWEEGKDKEAFSIAWLMSDTSASFNYLASRAADMSITYHHAAEDIAVRQGIANRREYAWRDHWLLVGPKSNPASLPVSPHTPADQEPTIFTLFSSLFIAATASPTSNVKFLSRYDKSAANIKESYIWSIIGQTPWAHPLSTWYHRYTEFPFQALKAASMLGEYTLTDRGTWLAVDESVRREMVIFKASTDSLEDPLLNPAHVLVGTRGKNRAMAHKFTDWMVWKNGGQKVIEEFEVGGARLYTVAPVSTELDSLDYDWTKEDEKWLE